MLTALQWYEGLREAIRQYAETRRVSPVVQVTLDSGDQFYLHSTIVAGSLLALSRYPEDRAEEWLPRQQDANDVREQSTPRVVLIDPNHIVRVELFPDAPGGRAVGFHLEAGV